VTDMSGSGSPERQSAASVYGVTLVKKHDGFGKARGGTEYRAVFREAREPDDAVARAYRMLKRDHPFENPMAWEVGRVGS